MREAPSIVIIEELLKAGATVKAYDPVAMPVAKRIFGERVLFGERNYDTLRDADALIIVTEWDEFRRPDWDRMKEAMKQPVIFDGRNIYDPARMRALGFVYYGIGRPCNHRTNDTKFS